MATTSHIGAGIMRSRTTAVIVIVVVYVLCLLGAMQPAQGARANGSWEKTQQPNQTRKQRQVQPPKYVWVWTPQGWVRYKRSRH